jgi:hypothetical protein
MEEERETAELLSVADRIPSGCTLVVLQYAAFAPTGSPDPLRHESSRLALRTGGVDVGHYEAVHPYFQVTFSGGPQIRRRLETSTNGLEKYPPRVDLSAVRGELDFVVVLGLDRATRRVREAAATHAVVGELSAHYERVATSEPTHLVTLWRERVPSGADGGKGSATGPDRESNSNAPRSG